MLKICIIKLGADGDVIRTLPLAKAIKKAYTESEITWIGKGDVTELIKGNPNVSKILEISKISEANSMSFDIAYNFDIETEAAMLLDKINAKKRYGFYRNGDYIIGFNLNAEYYLNTVFDDEIKKNNRKTYQEMMFAVAELPYNRENGEIFLDEKDRAYTREYATKNKLNSKKLIGVHMGASSRWPSKVWAEDKIKDFITKAADKGYNVLLFGGPNEVQNHSKITEEMNEKGIKIYQNNPRNTKREFTALVNLCDVVVCSDSFALHVSLALKKPTAGLFFCTSPHEIEDYGILQKITSPLLYNIFPERMDEYNEEVVNSVSAEEVMQKVEVLLSKINM